MKLSYNWLNEFVDLSGITPVELANLLTMKTCEVEGFEPFMDHMAKIPVALIEELTKHPDADKLKICKVNTGKETVQIVTGAANVELGKKFPAALVGVKLPDGREMTKAKLRGVESFGMLCSGGELGITQLDYAPAKIDGLMPLPDDWKVGAPLSDYFGAADVILDIDNKSITHRPDLWCHFGFAREIAALLGKPLKKNPEEATFKTQPAKLPKIEIEGRSAITYCGAELAGFKVQSSPLARQLRLLSVGQKPINNIVDISNSVLFEIGQPNHAFDRSKLGELVRVDYSKAKEKIALLDGTTHELPEGLVVIRDGSTPVALAGVMGGAGTETTAATEKLFLESATFHRSDIRKAVSKTGIRSDSSQRFEKAQNPGKAKAAIYRFASLLAEEQGGVTLSEIAEVSTEDYTKTQPIIVTNEFIDQKLGHIGNRADSNAAILKRLGFAVEEKGATLVVTPPAWRKWYDITIGEDLVEEIGRFIGYKEIAIEPALVPCETPRSRNGVRELEHGLRDLSANHLHLTEVLNYAFHSENDLKADEFFCTASEAMRMQNSLHSDMAFLRISPLAGLLRSIQANYREEGNTRLFEIEKLMLPPENATLARREAYFYAGALTSEAEPALVAQEVGAIVSTILASCGLMRHDQVFTNEAHGIFNPGRSGTAGTKDKKIFRFGEIHPKILAEFGIKTRVWYFDALIENLLALKVENPTYRPPFAQPAVDFDLTLVMPKRGEFTALKAAAGVVQPLVRRDLDKTVLVSFEHVSTFTGGNLKENEKAVSVRAVWRNPTRTLASDEIKKLQDGLILKMQKAGFSLR
ncbi:phenylalanine--tRNA ligase subunit beta [Turneriella parva]|uniref:Phenylalanine--tRNA ligase beta subunit n=1 Tax=Turneriella parva (strain ATCC BAA-1111 / DSM 21527 / NCTC 11395 / H) TaxID=869212 RepID=I4B6L0_TURPD|nr:phenylalanine--tRNA ligase subunit beta [Turneriella parva]AFM12917.1 phenylalanyl-tRNA synthetase beta subunit [Turneriella parva DSM 21527]